MLNTLLCVENIVWLILFLASAEKFSHRNFFHYGINLIVHLSYMYVCHSVRASVLFKLFVGFGLVSHLVIQWNGEVLNVHVLYLPYVVSFSFPLLGQFSRR